MGGRERSKVKPNRSKAKHFHLQHSQDKREGSTKAVSYRTDTEHQAHSSAMTTELTGIGRRLKSEIV